MTGRLSYMDSSGHTAVEWDTEAPDTVAAAQAEFRRLVGNGFLAYAVTPKDDGTTENVVIREFDPTLQDIVLVPQFQGGA